MPILSLAYPGGMSEYQLSMAPEHLEIAGYPLTMSAFVVRSL